MTRVLRLAEFGVVFFGLPGALAWWRYAGPPWGRLWLIPILITAFLVIVLALLRDPTFDRRRVWNWVGARRAWPLVLALFLLPAAMLGLGVAWYDERAGTSLLLQFPRERTGLWAFVMAFYPLMSVVPQEVIWRVFVFHRYAGVLDRRRGLRADPALRAAGDAMAPGSGDERVSWPMVFWSALAFGWMHVVFLNWIAPVLTFLGGLLFGWTYARTRSLGAVWMEHALWGCFIFTIGLGRFFVGGMNWRP